mgnify:CR=1 FL=1
MTTTESTCNKNPIFAYMKRAAIGYGFDDIWYNDYGNFVATCRKTNVEFRIDDRFGKSVVDISYPSAGMPRPTEEQLYAHVEKIQRAINLKQLFELQIEKQKQEVQ